MIYIFCKELYLSKNPYCVCFRYFVLIGKMKRLSQSGSSNFCPKLRKNALLISQSHFSNFTFHMITGLIALFLTNQIAGNTIDFTMNVVKLLIKPYRGHS